MKEEGVARVHLDVDQFQTLHELIDAFAERGECDLRRDLAAPLPLIVICDMLGVPPADRDSMLHWSDTLLGSLNGGADALGAAAEAFGAYAEYAQAMIAEKRANPGDDLVSVLVHGEVEGDRICDLHLWEVGPGHCAVLLSVVSERLQPPDVFKARLAGLAGLSHVSVEVNACPRSPGMRRNP